MRKSTLFRSFDSWYFSFRTIYPGARELWDLLLCGEGRGVAVCSKQVAVLKEVASRTMMLVRSLRSRRGCVLKLGEVAG